MRITKIAVKGLFGHLDHEIPLNQDSRITIIHGPNGVGKTVLLRMVHGLFHYEYDYICGIPFDRLQIEFEGGMNIVLECSPNSLDEHNVTRLVVSCTSIEATKETAYCISMKSNSELNAHVKELLPNLVEVQYLGGETFWIALGSTASDVSGDEELMDLFPRLAAGSDVLTKEDLLQKHPALYSDVYGSPPDWFMRVNNDASVELISSERLTRAFSKVELVWAWLISTIKLLIRAKEENLASVDLEKFHAIYPHSHNVVQDVASDYRISLDYFYTFDKMQNNYAEADKLIAALEEEAVRDSEIATELLEEHLSYLIDDNEEMQNEPEYQKALLFIEILNQRLLFKSFGFDEEQNSEIRSETGIPIPFSALSSGEQQLLILYHKLLFESEPNTLVMIDEPELSMNVVWQRNFLKDLQRIVELCEFDVLIATHSPQIIHDKWDWMVALGEKVDD